MATRHFSENWEFRDEPCAYCCVYCGFPSDIIDEVPSYAEREWIIALAMPARRFFRVRACHECRVALRTSGLWSLTARRTYIKHYLKRRYARLLDAPNWSDGDLAMLGPSLRGRILTTIHRRAVIRARLAYNEPMRILDES